MLRSLWNHEMKETGRLFAGWVALGLMWVLLARLQVLLLTDMPFVYVMFFGAIGILIYRYARSMHGAEAGLTFSTSLSPKQHMGIRYSAMVLWGLLSTFAVLGMVAWQGQSMGQLLAQISWGNRPLIWGMMAFSMLLTCVKVSASVTMAYLISGGRYPVRYTLAWFAVFSGVEYILRAVAKVMGERYLLVTSTDDVIIRSSRIVAHSFAFAVHDLLPMCLLIAACIVCCTHLVRRRLIVGD